MPGYFWLFVILDSFCFRFTSFTSDLGNHFCLLLSSSFHPSFAGESIFQAIAGGTLDNNDAKVSGRLIRSQYVRLSAAASPHSSLAGGGPMNVPQWDVGKRAISAVVVFLLHHLPHLLPWKSVAGGTWSLLVRLSREALQRTSDSLA